MLFIQNIFPCLDIKKILSPLRYEQQETIFSVGKSFASINPWDCLEVGVRNLFDKLKLKILHIEVNINKSLFSLKTNESIVFRLFFNFVIVKVLLLFIISSSNKTFLNLPSEFNMHK